MCQNLFLQKGNFVSQVMNKYEFVPKMPNSSDLELVFDTSFHDVQPHLFKVSLVGLKVEILLSLQVCHSTANVGSPGVGINMVRRLLRDTLAI